MPDLSRAASVSALEPYRIVMRPPGQEGADWFGPLAPLAPVAPPQVAGRQFDFPPGFNLVTRPRAWEPIGFWDLRALADALDLVRIIIETRKDQLARLGWTIRPRMLKPQSASADPRTTRLVAFFRKPDGSTPWDAWLRTLLEDLFVIDAPALWMERTRDGSLAALHPIDGASLKRVIDDWGRTPKPPLPAYQQVLHGLPAVDYTTRDILYRPRNMRVHKVYGFSPVEQILVTVNIALRRQVYQLQYYTEGNIPEALIGVPENWTPQQIEQFQNYWDSLNAGNTAERRHARFVPGGVAKTFVPTKEPDLTGATDEWLARLCCYAFSVSPQPFTRLMNRATAETAQDEAEAEGLAPIKNWVKGLIDDVISSEFGAPDLEFAWADDRATDPQKVASVAVDYVKCGIKSVNEVRGELGLDPVPGGERPMIQTAQGPMPLGSAAPEPPAQPQLFARYNANHYGPGPQGEQFAPADEGGSDAASGGSPPGVHTVAVASSRPIANLANDERAGGHTIAEHVGKSSPELKARLDADTSLRAASSYRDLTEANATVQLLLDSNLSAIQSWLSIPTSGRRLDIAVMRPSAQIGSVFLQGAVAPVPGNGARASLRRDPSLPDGFRVFTSYPTFMADPDRD